MRNAFPPLRVSKLQPVTHAGYICQQLILSYKPFPEFAARPLQPVHCETIGCQSLAL
jgi:hypothetical protein